MTNAVVVAKTNKAVEGVELSAKAVKALTAFNKAKEAEAKAKAEAEAKAKAEAEAKQQKKEDKERLLARLTEEEKVLLGLKKR